VSPAPMPKRPFRDSAILYGVLAAILLVAGIASGRGVLASVLVAFAVFAVATSYAWWRFQRRIDRKQAKP
jgi:membrane protein implicated in regulation of membrane protease activity